VDIPVTAHDLAAPIGADLPTRTRMTIVLEVFGAMLRTR